MIHFTRLRVHQLLINEFILFLQLKVFLAMHRPIETVIEIVIGTNAIRSSILQSLTRLSASTDSSRNESVADPDMTYFI